MDVREGVRRPGVGDPCVIVLIFCHTPSTYRSTLLYEGVKMYTFEVNFFFVCLFVFYLS